jgi:O-acetyl-ADP-ribose deacetylase (regulator of RNase III)
LLPQGVSGAIKRRAGYEPFRELARHGSIPLGGAVETSAGRLPFRAIIHVAGINLLWRSSERAIRGCVRSALGIAREKGYRSIAVPLAASARANKFTSRVYSARSGSHARLLCGQADMPQGS